MSASGHAARVEFVPTAGGADGYAAVCTCGWRSEPAPVVHHCRGDHSGTDVADYWRARGNAVESAQRAGRGHALAESS